MSHDIIIDQFMASQGTSSAKLRIINAAANLIFEKGYFATGIKDISLSCERTKSALYGHYASKSSIVIEILQCSYNYCQNNFFVKTFDPFSPPERLSFFIKQLKLFFAKPKIAIWVFWLFSELSQIKLFRSYLEEYISLWLRRIRKLFPKNISNSECVVKNILANIHGTILLNKIYPNFDYSNSICDYLPQIVSALQNNAEINNE